MGFMAAKYGGGFKGGRKGGGRKQGGFRHNGRRAPKFGKRSVSSGEFTCRHFCCTSSETVFLIRAVSHMMLLQDPTLEKAKAERVKEREVKARAEQ